MSTKQQFYNDIDQYGYVFLAFRFAKEPERISEIAAFDSASFAFACWNPTPEQKKRGLIVDHLKLKTAKNALLNGKCQVFVIWNGLDQTQVLCPEPFNKDFLAFVKGWFCCLEGAIND